MCRLTRRIPAERIAYLLQDSAPVAVLAQALRRADLLGAALPVIDLDRRDWRTRPRQQSARAGR